MRKLLFLLFTLTAITVAAQDQNPMFSSSTSFNDTASLRVFSTMQAGPNVNLLAENKGFRKVLGTSKKGRSIPVYYFPGTSNRKALVIGGVHGSELSAVEVARELIRLLQTGEKPYYNVIVVPTLFPDNIAAAECGGNDRVAHNCGRYSTATAVDPNRQMPPLGKAFDSQNPFDAFGRPIEAENVLLLQLIQSFLPDRIVNLHAIKDTARAGVYADPRTDCEGNALGYTSDSALAITMAKYIETAGGSSPGNNLRSSPTALYYLDPVAAQKGEKQKRNLTGANVQGKINGVSLGSWASTAVCDSQKNIQRSASRLFTVEFPGYQKPSEYKTERDRLRCRQQIELYASGIQSVFLQAYFVEEGPGDAGAWAVR